MQTSRILQGGFGFTTKNGGLSMLTMRPGEPEAVPDLLYHATRLRFRDLAEHFIAEHPEHVNARGGLLVTPIHAAASARQG